MVSLGGKRRAVGLGGVFLLLVLLSTGLIPARGQSPPTALAQAVTLRGNLKSKVFHAPGCRYYLCKACVVIFATREEALAAGYRPCKVCNP